MSTPGPAATGDARVPESTGQTFLVGPEIYLRPPRAGDAERAVAWRPSPFPASAKTVEEELEKGVPKDARNGVRLLIACRVADDEPVGSARLDEREDWPTVSGDLFVGPAFGSQAQGLKSAMLDLLVPWLSEERGSVSVAFDLDGGEPEVLAAAEANGMRPAFRVRGARWRDGARHDWVTYQKLHPTWLAKLGDPGPGIATAGEPPTAPRSPAPRRWPESSSPVPPNAVMVGERLVLRPFLGDEVEGIARASLQETEDSFGEGRLPASALVLADWWGKQGEEAPPDEIQFAIVLRETGEVIGDNGLYAIDWVSRTAETGTFIYRQEHRSGGLGTEAKHLLLEYGFERLGLHVVWSWVVHANARSAAAIRKQGYRDAGRIDWIGVGRGEFQSAFLFDLLAEEWRAARR